MLKHNMVAIGEGAPAGGGGVPGASPAPAANPSPPAGPPAPRVPYNPPPDDDAAPRPLAPAGGPPAPGPGPENNPIPYVRHKEMLEKAIAEAVKGRDSYYEQQFQKLMERMPRRADPEELVRNALRAAGYEVPDPNPPQPVTMDVMQRMFQQQQQEFARALQLRTEHDEAQSELTRLSSEHPELFEGEFGTSYKEALSHLWGAYEDLPMREVAGRLQKLMDAYYDIRVKQYAEQKTRDGRSVPIRTAAPPARGVSGGRPTHDLATE